MSTTSEIRSFRLHAALLIAGALLIPPSMAFAQAARPNPVAAKNARTASESAKKQAETVAAKHAEAPAAIKKAAESLSAAYQAAAAAQLKMAEAYEIGIASDVAAAVGEGAKATAALARANELLLTLQNEASYNLMTSVESWKKITPESVTSHLETYLTARKSAAAAAAKLAGLLTPDGNAEAIDAARDEWFAADAEAKLASRIWSNSSNLATRAALAEKSSNADLAAKIKELEKIDAELFALVKQQNELQLKLRKIERQRLQGIAAATELAKPKKK